MSLSIQNIGWGIIAGLASGSMFGLIGLGGFPAMLGIYFSAVPLFMVGLSYGKILLLISIFSGITILSFIFGVSAASLFLFCDVIPAFLLVFLLLKKTKSKTGEQDWYPVGYALSWLAIAGGIFALLMMSAIIGAAISSGLPSEITAQEAVSKLLERGFSTVMVANQEAQVSFIEMLTPVFMSFIALLWFVRILIAVFISEYILLKLNKALRPRPDYLNIYIQNWLLVIVIISVFTGLFSSGDIRYFALNFAAAISLPFCILGLCWVHKTVLGVRYSMVILIVFYGLLFLVSQISFIVLGILGLFEQFSRIYSSYRTRLKEEK